MFKQTLNPLTSKVNILNTTSSTSSPSLLSIISSSSPDLVLLCGDGASPLLLHSAVAQSHFPVIFNVFQVIININVLIFLVITLCLLIIMITITIQELMALSGPSLYWNESAQVAINLPSSSSPLSSSLSSVSSLPSPSSPGGDQPALRLLRPPHPPPLLHLLKPALRLPWQGAG